MQRNRFFLNFLCIFLLLFLFSCSLNYDEAQEEKSTLPEFVFHEAKYLRTEDKKISLKFTADKIEQYNGIDAMYGTNISFVSYDTKGNKTIDGHCDLFSANNETKIYLLFSNIFLHSYEKKAEITAESLRWNGKTENLIGTIDDTVTLTTDQFSVSGIGFTASQKDASFSLQKNISGIIFEKKDTDIESREATGETVNEN